MRNAVLYYASFCKHFLECVHLKIAINNIKCKNIQKNYIQTLMLYFLSFFFFAVLHLGLTIESFKVLIFFFISQSNLVNAVVNVVIDTIVLPIHYCCIVCLLLLFAEIANGVHIIIRELYISTSYISRNKSLIIMLNCIISCVQCHSKEN